MSEAQHTTLPLRDPGKQDRSAPVSPTTTTTTAATWVPDLQRRQSWSAQDHKHEMHMATVDAVRTGPGFTERS